MLDATDKLLNEFVNDPKFSVKGTVRGMGGLEPCFATIARDLAGLLVTLTPYALQHIGGAIDAIISIVRRSSANSEIRLKFNCKDGISLEVNCNENEIRRLLPQFMEQCRNHG